VNWTWLTWSNVTPYILAIPGCIALWRTIRNDRARLRFNIELHGLAENPDDDWDVRWVVSVTITNDSARPVTITACQVGFVYETVSGNKRRSGYVETSQKIGLGEACSLLVELPIEPWTSDKYSMGESRIVELSYVHAEDSTHKRWNPTHSEMRRFRHSAGMITPIRSQP
jgi:hypothetical protein